MMFRFTLSFVKKFYDDYALNNINIDCALTYSDLFVQTTLLNKWYSLYCKHKEYFTFTMVDNMSIKKLHKKPPLNHFQ